MTGTTGTRKGAKFLSLASPQFTIYFSRVLFLFGQVFFLACTQNSAFLTKRYVDFNFTSEGFLSVSVLQTIGWAEYQSTNRGTNHDKALCLRLAQHAARQRILRVMLHVRFDLPSNRTKDSPGPKDFSTDYPLHFRQSDFLRAELKFSPILKRAFIALQDSRDHYKKKCMVVYRITGKHLANEIRQVPVDFKPTQKKTNKTGTLQKSK